MKKSRRSTETRYELSTNKISPRSLRPSFPHPSRFLVIDATSSVNFSSWITGDRVTKLAEQFFVRRRVDDSCVYMYIYIYRERERERAVYILSVEQVSTEQGRDTKFRKTFRFPLISSPRVFVIRRFFQTQPLSRTPADPWTGSNSPEDGASSSVNTVSITFLPRSFRFPDESIRVLSIQPRLPRA